ncbi:MAG: hypothetical protein GQ574_07950 [Crocinitomix sp.]|nr:hypothetical protein [Crocinitomix sp.]
MEQFTEFLDKYFIYIWLVLAVSMVSIFFIRGKAAIKMFENLDLSNVAYSEKSASGYSTKSFGSKFGGASKVLHIIITDKELVLKTYLFLAFIAKKNDLLHIIPLTTLTNTELKDGRIFSKLHVRFTGIKGEEKEVVLMSKRNLEIKAILDKYV